MFIGHFAVALTAKRCAPKASLGTYALAAEFLDVLWPVFLLLGVEHVRISPGITRVTPLDFYDYPWSHSLAMVLLWSLLFAVGYGLVRKDWRTAGVLAAVVASHWFLDYATHRPDMPLAPGIATKLGLGLWNSLLGTIAAELTMFVGALALYARATKARDRIGSIGLWSFAVFCVIAWLAAILGPPPPGIKPLAYGSFSIWLLLAWCAWVDRHRAPLRNAAAK
jgi:membrane-bound metal-dependent hydrolase YbcI (DUF457 family)